jgi:hypothetical protein
VQQSCPGEQHASAQQKPPAHAPASISHGGLVHVPWSQYRFGPASRHESPHAPQLLMSFASLTHVPAQQLSPQLQSASVVQPLPAPDELLEDEALDAVAVKLLEALVLAAVLGAAPPPPSVSPVRAPQPVTNAHATTTGNHLAARTPASVLRSTVRSASRARPRHDVRRPQPRPHRRPAGSGERYGDAFEECSKRAARSNPCGEGDDVDRGGGGPR